MSQNIHQFCFSLNFSLSPQEKKVGKRDDIKMSYISNTFYPIERLEYVSFLTYTFEAHFHVVIKRNFDDLFNLQESFNLFDD